MLRLEIGKAYRTRDGRKVVVTGIKYHVNISAFLYSDESYVNILEFLCSDDVSRTESGLASDESHLGVTCDNDFVAEWSDEPEALKLLEDE